MATKEKVEATTAVTEGAKAQKLDYTDWLLVDLRAELERRGSDKKGTTRALAMRLEGLDGQLDAEYDSSQSNEEPSPPSQEDETQSVNGCEWRRFCQPLFGFTATAGHQGRPKG